MLSTSKFDPAEMGLNVVQKSGFWNAFTSKMTSKQKAVLSPLRLSMTQLVQAIWYLNHEFWNYWKPCRPSRPSFSIYVWEMEALIYVHNPILHLRICICTHTDIDMHMLRWIYVFICILIYISLDEYVYVLTYKFLNICVYVISDHNQGSLNQFVFLEEDGNRKVTPSEGRGTNTCLAFTVHQTLY